MMELLKTPGFMTVLTMLINGVLFVLVLALKASWTPKKEHDELKSRVDKIENALRGLEVKIDALPDQKTVNALTLQIEKLNGRLDVFDAHFGGLSRDLKRLENHLNLLDRYQRKEERR